MKETKYKCPKCKCHLLRYEGHTPLDIQWLYCKECKISYKRYIRTGHISLISAEKDLK